MTVKTAFQTLHTSLCSIYDNREAFTITRYIFEDIFKIFNPQTERTLTTAEIAQFQDVQTRLLRHEPWQHVVGFADFFGLKLHVSPDVLIPRPETEELVQWILDDCAPRDRVLDIGTGSGCIPIALKRQQASLAVLGIDISEAALQIAQKNAALNTAEVRWTNADILDRKSWDNFEKFEIIVSNPPYVLATELPAMPRNVRDFDPHTALFVSEKTPLLFYEAIADFAVAHLAVGGRLYFEIHQDFGQEMIALLQQRGFREVELRQDIFGCDRMIKAW
jgi:release factor glutamine methyltransferase